MLPISLDIKNFCSHKDSCVDFTQFQSALIVGNNEGNYDVSNGTGKSSIFEAIPWVLFGKSTSEFADDVILWGEETCSVTFEFTHDRGCYKVVRGRNRQSSTATVSFYEKKEDSWIDISGSTASLTNKKIISTINFDYNTFINSAYFRQNDVSEFAKSNAARKKEILKSIVDLSKWDEYEDEAKSRVKNIKSEIKILESTISDYDNISLELVKNKSDIERSTLQFSEKKSLLDAKEHALESAQSRYYDLKKDIDTAQWDNAVASLTSEKSKQNNLKMKLSVVNSDIQKFKRDIDAVNQQIVEKKEIIESIVVIKDVDDQISLKNEEFVSHKSTIASCEDMLQHLQESSHELSSGECPVCTQSITDDFAEKLVYEREQRKDDLNSKIIFAKNKLIEISAQVKKLEAARKNNQKEKNLRNEIKQLTAEVSVYQSGVERLVSEYDILSKELSSVTENILFFEKTLESLKNSDFQSLQRAISSLKDERDELSKEVSSLDRLLGGLTERNIYLNEKMAQYDKVKGELEQKKERLSVLEYLAKYLGKNGIQIVLLETVISDIEIEANKILSHICQEQFEVMLETQRKGSDGESIVETLDLVVRKDGAVQSFSSLSGGEQFRISLALRIALSEISCRHGGSNLEFILLDEVNSPLDRSGTESLFMNVIKSLEEKYKILVITHNDLLKEKFDHIITVTKVNGESSTSFSVR